MGSTAYPALAINTTGESPLNMLGKIEQIRGSQIQQQLQTVQLDEARTEQQSRTALMKAWADNGGDYNKTISDARTSGKVTPGDLMAFQTHAVELQTKAALLTKEQLANESSTNDIFANTLESFKQLPPDQRTPDAIKTVAGSLANSGVDISKYMPAFQSLAQNPTDENIKTLELGLKGRQWVVQNEKVQREEASAPTVTQAQQKTAADVAKSTDEAKAAHIQLLSLPTPEEASTRRAAELNKTRAETAAANAIAKEKTAQTALLGAEPVMAYDPKTDQRVLSTMPQSKQLGYTNPVKVTEGDINKETELTRQLNDVQLNTSRYRESLKHTSPADSTQVTNMEKIISDKDLVSGLVPLPAMFDYIKQGRQASAWNDLTPENQEAVMGYLRMKGSAIAFQKAMTQTGRTSKEGLMVEFGNIPSPVEGATIGLKRLDAFQENIDTVGKGVTRVPWLPQPSDIRRSIETSRPSGPAPAQKTSSGLEGMDMGTTGP